jgi:putative spermidine/putrescine transport system permease protein
MADFSFGTLIPRPVQPARSHLETMTATATVFSSASRPIPAASRIQKLTGAQLAGLLLLLPAAGFLLAFFVIPALTLFAYSMLTQRADGVVTLPLTAAHFQHFFGTTLYTHVLIATLRMAAVTAVLAALLGYPVAMVMVRGNALVMRLMTIVLVAPLIVSVVVRTYGWQLILANNQAGVLNWVLLSLGVIHQPIRVLYSETAVIVGSLHVFFPMMVLPLASALAKINPQLEDAARTLGAPSWRVFWRVSLPLSLPGLAVGFTLVFSLTASSYVTPAILGGTSAQMLGNLIEQQIAAVYDWPFGATVALVLVATVLAINLASTWFFERRNRA